MVKPITLTDVLKPGFIDHLIETSIWQAKPLSEQPVVELIRWQVMQLPNGDRHFVGWNIAGSEGRTTSKLVEFDAVTRGGWTSSGREYRLLGLTGKDIDGVYTWQRWMKVTGNTSAIEVSQDFQTLSNAAQVLGLESAK